MIGFRQDLDYLVAAFQATNAADLEGHNIHSPCLQHPLEGYGRGQAHGPRDCQAAGALQLGIHRQDQHGPRHFTGQNCFPTAGSETRCRSFRGGPWLPALAIWRRQRCGHRGLQPAAAGGGWLPGRHPQELLANKQPGWQWPSPRQSEARGPTPHVERVRGRGGVDRAAALQGPVVESSHR